MHLTLKFLGQVTLPQRAAVEGALATAVAAAPDLQLHLGNAGSFADRGVPRVLWVGVGGDTKALSELAAHVDLALAGVGFAPERRPFAAHLTLARLPDEMPASVRHRVIAVASAVELPKRDPFVVREVALVRSHLGPGGARYEIVGRWP